MTCMYWCCFCTRIAPLLLLLFGTLPSVAQTTDKQVLKRIEAELKNTYEKRLLLILPPKEQNPSETKVPAWLTGYPLSNIPIVLLIERVRLKEGELELRGTRIYFYQDARQSLQSFKGERLKHRLRWKGDLKTAAQSQSVIGDPVDTLADAVARLQAYWPPDTVPEPDRENKKESKPTKEIAPGIYDLGKDATPPTCIFCPYPDYPHQARTNRHSGTIIVRVVVTETPRVAGMRLVKSLWRELDEQALRALSNWQFEPARLNGKPIRVVLMVEVDFRLT